MSGKNVDDYLNDGIYGVKQPKQAELNRFLGTYRERVVLCLTIGEVMQNKGLDEITKAMKETPNSKLLLNGQIHFKYLANIKKAASKHSILYTIISNKDIETDIGAVVCVDHAIDYESVFLSEQNKKDQVKTPADNNNNNHSFLDKIKGIFSTK